MRSVAVVGGGIGGLVLANLLSSTGWPVEVYEGARALPEKGSALGMWPDAMRVFDSSVSPTTFDAQVIRSSRRRCVIREVLCCRESRLAEKP